MIYLDSAATTPIDNRVLDAMMPYLTDQYGNAGTLYGIGRRAAKAIDLARRQVAAFVGAKPEQIVFTSGGSEANNMVFAGLADYMTHIGKTQIITTQIEHDSVLKAVRALCNRAGNTKDRFYADFLRPLETGAIHPQDVEGWISDKTGVVSVMHTNNETGVENPVKKIAELCKSKGVLFHTDAVQAAGCCRLDVEEIGCDFLSLSGHKIHAPKGTGALYIRDQIVMSPLIYGGASQEFGLRGGTENVAGIVGFGKACELAEINREKCFETVSNHRRKFYDVLVTTLRSHNIDDFISINGEPIESGGKTLNIRIENVDAETLLLMLDARGVCVSAGSACRSHESKPSRVLTAMGLTPDEARSSIRVSFSDFNTNDEIEEAGKIMAECIATLKAGGFSFGD